MPAAQSRRIVSGLPFVEALARRMASTMPHSIDVGDLVQDGVIGLIDAAHRFDEGRGIKFETFAERRIRGAMIDALRRDAWPRGVRRVQARARGGARDASPRAGPRAVAVGSGRESRHRRKAAGPHHRPHPHHRIDIAARHERDCRRSVPADGAGAVRARSAGRRLRALRDAGQSARPR